MPKGALQVVLKECFLLWYKAGYSVIEVSLGEVIYLLLDLFPLGDDDEGGGGVQRFWRWMTSAKGKTMMWTAWAFL